MLGTGEMSCARGLQFGVIKVGHDGQMTKVGEKTTTSTAAAKIGSRNCRKTAFGAYNTRIASLALGGVI
jgi:hypothetical protein